MAESSRSFNNVTRQIARENILNLFSFLNGACVYVKLHIIPVRPTLFINTKKTGGKYEQSEAKAQ